MSSRRNSNTSLWDDVAEHRANVGIYRPDSNQGHFGELICKSMPRGWKTDKSGLYVFPNDDSELERHLINVAETLNSEKYANWRNSNKVYKIGVATCDKWKGWNKKVNSPYLIWILESFHPNLAAKRNRVGTTFNIPGVEFDDLDDIDENDIVDDIRSSSSNESNQNENLQKDDASCLNVVQAIETDGAFDAGLDESSLKEEHSNKISASNQADDDIDIQHFIHDFLDPSTPFDLGKFLVKMKKSSTNPAEVEQLKMRIVQACNTIVQVTYTCLPDEIQYFYTTSEGN